MERLLLEQAILYECMELTNSVPGECCAAIRKTFRADTEVLSSAAQEILLRELQVDDYVVCTGTLLKVMEVHKSKYDLVTCRVKPLDGYLKDEDWLPSSMLTLFHRPLSGERSDDVEMTRRWAEAMQSDIDLEVKSYDHGGSR